jgi:transcription elongation factor GreB
VFFGAYVALEDGEGGEVDYRIVGADEIDPVRGYISVDSPMARALLGKSINDEISVVLPESQATFKVLKISYKTPH